ncbi:RUS family member 1 isoform X2 [Carettochelys insculpta]|uniref:RUS family member 1 isoform X2 n=1 Tax=Carettochelys insculpta TaxID=44489 RepID=UPI003EB705B0
MSSNPPRPARPGVPPLPVPAPAMPNLGIQPLCTEQYGSRSARCYLPSPDGHLSCVGDEPGRGGWRSLREIFMSVFLPQGYPESVSTDYLPYQIWDTVQAFASSITGALATQAVLKGVGVGDQTSTVAAATVTWILKDGTGMVGRILFAWMKGSKLDCDAKQWRLFADALNDLAIFMEILAPAFPACFTLIVCTSGFFKCIVGVAGGATRAALTMHQARRDNMADVSAKDGSQETLVNLAGLLVSLLLIPLVTNRLQLTYALYGLFTALHLYANYRAVRAVCMETLNRARLRLALHHFLGQGWVPTPAHINPQEPLLPGLQRHLGITLGAPLHMLVSRHCGCGPAPWGQQRGCHPGLCPRPAAGGPAVPGPASGHPGGRDAAEAAESAAWSPGRGGLACANGDPPAAGQAVPRVPSRAGLGGLGHGSEPAWSGGMASGLEPKGQESSVAPAPAGPHHCTDPNEAKML